VKNAVSWDVAPYSFSVLLAHAGSTLEESSTVKMEAVRSSEKSVHINFTALHPIKRRSSTYYLTGLLLPHLILNSLVMAQFPAIQYHKFSYF
jgi:hypothetical protein